MPLVINSLRRGHTHTDDLHRINFKKPGVHQPGLKIVPIMANSMLVDNLLPLLFFPSHWHITFASASKNILYNAKWWHNFENPYKI